MNKIVLFAVYSLNKNGYNETSMFKILFVQLKSLFSFRNIQSLLKLNMIMKIRKNQKEKENSFQQSHVGRMMYQIHYNAMPVKQIVRKSFSSINRHNHF